MAGKGRRGSIARELLAVLGQRRTSDTSGGDGEDSVPPELSRLLRLIKWHINHSLSPRQKEVIKAHLAGQTEREIAQDLGVRQQVVHIYKQRAIKKLQHMLRA